MLPGRRRRAHRAIGRTEGRVAHRPTGGCAEAAQYNGLMTSPPPRITVLVADDHPVFRDGLERAMRERPDLDLVGIAADGCEALEGIRALRPEVALLDVRMPGLEGLDVLNAVRRDGLPTRVVMLSAAVEGPVVHRALAAGAAGYLSKDADRRTICDAVAAAARGTTVVGAELQAGVIEEIRALGVDADRPLLSAREREVLRLVAEGLSTSAVAARLVLSPATVKTHLAHLYDKLGVSERAAAVAEAMRRGLLE
jgi:two-component system, NarL family, nitrate/nitrite response regulator NarL